jgi:hypothetical protein
LKVSAANAVPNFPLSNDPFSGEARKRPGPVNPENSRKFFLPGVDAPGDVYKIPFVKPKKRK